MIYAYIYTAAFQSFNNIFITCKHSNLISKNYIHISRLRKYYRIA